MPIIKARSSSIIESVDLRGQPTAPTAGQSTNTNQLASTAFVRTAIAELIDSSPDLLNTLAELAAAINNDEAFSVTVANSIATKLPKDGSEAMTGELILSGAPTQALGAVTKQYVDDLVDGQMIYSTDDVDEGTTNLYYTDARVRSGISLFSDNTSVLSYNSTTGQFEYNHPNSDGILEGSTNLYFSQSRARDSISINSDDSTIISYSAQTGQFTFTTPDTDKIVEGSTNLYFTTSRARNSISNGSNISYDSGTGIISTQAAVWSVNGQEHDVVLDTDDINEGSTNQYFTNARARNAVSLTTDDSNILSYNGGTGTFTFVTPSTDAIDEGTSNLYYTDSRVRAAVSASGDISYNDATGNFSYSTPTTDGVNEGSTNLYFTTARARNSVSLNTDNSDVLSYDNSTGEFTFSLGSQTTDDVAEGSTNLYFTNARARSAVSVDSDWNNISYNSTTGVVTVNAPNTDDVNEGSTNQYFTTTRARSSVSAVHSSGDGDLTYNSSTGVFDYEGPTSADYRQAVSAVKDSGHGDLQYSSSTGVFTYTGPTNANYRGAISVTDNGGDGSLDYDSSTGVITYTGPDDSEVRAHFSADTATGAQYDSSTGVFSLSGIPNTSLVNDHITINGTIVDLGGSNSFGTDSVTEESNLYFTNGRARSAISLTSDNTSVLDYNSTTGEFTFSLGSQTTDDVAEGTNNLYFTNTRARNAVSAVDAGGDGSFDYDSTTGAFTYTGPSSSEVRAHFSAITGTGISYDDGSFFLASIPNSSLTNSSITLNGTSVSLGGSNSFDTDSVNEGTTNKYYTSARVRSEVTAVDLEASGSFSYDSASGEFYFDATGVVATVNGQKGYVTLDSDDISEGTNNQYFTTTRARNSVSGGTGVTYTSSTGVIAIGQDVSTTSNVTFNDVTVAGDLTVQGTLTAIQSTTVEINDVNLTLAKGSANATQANGAGLTIDGAGATITYSSADDSWNFNKDVNVTGGLSITGDLSATTFIGDLTGNVTGQVSDLSNHTTDDVTEGATNLYFTNGRAASAISLTSDKTSVLSYNSGTGTFTFNLASATTSDIAEGTNLYFTDARARSAISVTDNGGDGSLSYNSSTGTIEYTGPSASETRAHFSATTASGITYDNSTGTFALASIPNSSLTNSSLTVNGATVSLGGSTSFGTDSVTEESNLYYTDSRARNSISLTSDNTSVLDYNSSTGEFTFSLGSQTTDDVAEGTNNLYFTTARARGAVSIVDAGGDGSFAYDSTTGVFTYTGPNDSEVRAHFSATKTGGDGNFSYDSATGAFSYTGPDQDDYRLAISASNVSGDGSISYDDSTGIISYTGPSAEEVRAHFSAITGTGISYDAGAFFLADIPNSSLTNNTVTFNGVEVALGASGSFGTDSVTEESNLYFTQARARGAVSLVTSDSSVFSYDSATGVFTYSAAGLSTDEVAEGDVNLYFTQARARDSISANGWQISYDSASGVISMATPSTDDVNEGTTNKYFTNARARQAISLTSDNSDALSYDNTTGTFTFTLATVDTDEIAEGNTNLYFTTARARNSVSNGSNIDYDSSTGIISTQAAVWSVNGQEHAVTLDTDDIDEGSANLYFTDSRARSAITLTTDDSNILSYNSGTGALTFVTPSTDAIDEGENNLYYTDARADARIAAASVFDLADVGSSGTLQDGYTLVWSSAEQTFVPQNVAVTATTLNFTGDGTTLSFSTGVNVTSIDNTQVYINGLIQAPTYSYTLSTTNDVTSIVFDTAPESNDYIFVRVSSTSSLTAGGVLNETSTIDGGTF
jgi:hypothetical protein